MDESAIAGHDVVNCCQAEARALRGLRGEESFEQMRVRRGVHAAPVVRHHEKGTGERCGTTGLVIRFREHLHPAIAGFNRDLASAGHCIPRIEYQVEQNLLRLRWIHFDQTQIGIEMEYQLNVFPNQANQQIAQCLRRSR